MSLSASHLALLSLFSDSFVLALAKSIPEEHQKGGKGELEGKGEDVWQMSIFLNVLFNSVNIKVDMPREKGSER